MKRYIQRYTEQERINHWIVAICFILVALSGLAFFHPSLFWLVNLFGGGPWARILHPFIGFAMFAFFVVMMVKLWHHNTLDENDKKWLGQWKDVLNNREENLPEVGRYNGAQKVLFWLMVACAVVLLLSGIIAWRSVFADLFPITLIRLASLLHALAATVLIMGIIVHVYAAIWVKGSFRGMLRGDVSAAWAKKHHLAWYRENMR